MKRNAKRAPERTWGNKFKKKNWGGDTSARARKYFLFLKRCTSVSLVSILLPFSKMEYTQYPWDFYCVDI